MNSGEPHASRPSDPSDRPTQQLKVPRQDQSLLMVPPRGDLVDLARSNSGVLSETPVDLQGLSLVQLRGRMRSRAVSAATDYLQSRFDVDIDVPADASLFVTGHQPELFHPGVWVKNFIVADLARNSGGVGLNLIIDNDTVASRQIKVPVGTRQNPRAELVPFDAAQHEQPWEDAAIADLDTFWNFGPRIRAAIGDHWKYEPLAVSAWEGAVRSSLVSSNLRDALVAARVATEHSLGIRNLEVPMSRICSGIEFFEFATYLLANLPRFHKVHNEAVRSYRRTHKLRSTTHPVPELVTDDGWFEAPFWVWRRGDKIRLRPFARQQGSVLELRDSKSTIARLPLTPDTPLQPAAQKLADLFGTAVRFRTRALTTTLLARVLLADLFVHGIGGAKYDEITDQICERFLGIRPPVFATSSATLHLPIGPAFPATRDDLLRQQHQVRDLRYNPDRGLSQEPGSSQAVAVAEKRRLISGLNGRRPTAEEHRRLAELNSQLADSAGAALGELQSVQDRIQGELRANSVLQDREFAWCLYPPSAAAFLKSAVSA